MKQYATLEHTIKALLVLRDIFVSVLGNFKTIVFLLFTVLDFFSVEPSIAQQPQLQQHELKFIKIISSSSELPHLADSLLLPLLVDHNKVYLIHSECFSRNDGGNSNERNSGGNSNERSSDGNSNERNSGGNTNERSTGGNSNDRMSGGNSNERASGGNTNERESGGNTNERNNAGNSNERNAGGNSNERSTSGNSNERNAGGFVGYFSCGNDANGTLVIYFHNMSFDKTIKVFYNKTLYTTNTHFFKLKNS